MNDNTFDKNELEEIQAKIEKDLAADITHSNPAQEMATQTNEQAGQFAGLREQPPAYAEVEEQSVIYTASAGNYPPPAATAAQPEAYAAPKAPETEAKDLEPVYTETIKKQKAPKHGFLRTVIAAVIVGVVGGPLAGFFIGAGTQAAKRYFGTETPQEEPAALTFAAQTTAQEQENALLVAPNPSSIIDNFSAVVELVEPSVVAITSVAEMEVDSFFFRQSYEQPSQGSGIIFDEDAQNVYVVTNYHVVSGADRVGVSVRESEPVSASLVGAERNADIAVISIKKADLAQVGITSVTTAKFGSSDDMRVGEVVLAIGNALGEGNTATLGIISAKNKEIIVEGLKLTVMQTDAAINPGNSGGPLINTKGEVIAINVAKTLYGVEGTGYSLPAGEVIPIIDNIREQTPKAFMGINMTDLPEETAEMFSLPMGVLVVEILENSAAEKAGMKRNDVITSFGGKPVFNTDALQEYIAMYKVGDEVEVKVYRIDEGTVALKLVLGERPVSTRF